MDEGKGPDHDEDTRYARPDSPPRPSALWKPFTTQYVPAHAVSVVNIPRGGDPNPKCPENHHGQ